MSEVKKSCVHKNTTPLNFVASKFPHKFSGIQKVAITSRLEETVVTLFSALYHTMFTSEVRPDMRGELHATWEIYGTFYETGVLGFLG